MNKLATQEPVPETIAYMVEGTAVRCFLEDGEPTWFVSSDLGKSIGLSRTRMVHIVAELEAEDKGVRETHTPGGKQSLTVISRSGAYQTIAQLQDKELGRRLRKWLADIGVAYETGRLGQPALTRADLDAWGAHLAQSIVAGVAAILTPFLDRLTAPRTARRGKAIQGDTLPPGEETRMHRLGYRRAADFLFREEGQKPAYGRASSLANRCANYCERNSIPFYRYGRHLFLHGDTLRQIHRFGWSAKTAMISEGQMQMGLFQ